METSSRVTRLDDEAVCTPSDSSKSTATSPAAPPLSRRVTPLEAMLAPARSLLREWTLGRYLATKEAVSGPPLQLTSDTSVGEALELLAGAGCLSAPVLDCDQGHIESATTWLGFLDVADIVRSLLRELYPWLLDEPRRSTAHGMMAALATDPVSVQSVLQNWAGELFLLRWVRLLRPGSDGELLYKGLAFKSLLEVVTFGLSGLPVDSHPGMEGLVPCHRIAVFDVAETTADAPSVLRISTIVSQSDIISFLLYHARAGKLGDLAGASVASLGWLRGAVCVPASMPTIAAFALMLNRSVSAVGITASLDEQAPLVGSLSVSDVRALRTAADFQDLALPVAQFLSRQYDGEAFPATDSDVAAALQRMEVTSPARGGSPKLWLVSCYPEDSLTTVLDKMVTCGVHRVWVVHRLTGVALGVVTMSDVLQLLAVDPSSDDHGWLEGSTTQF